MTCEMPVTSMPRAAMSVATSTRARPLRNCSSALIRAGWLLLPWIALTRTPPVSSVSATRSADRLVRVNTMTRDIAGSVSSLPSSARFPAVSTKCTCCSIGSLAGAVTGDVHPHRVAQQRFGQLGDLRRHGGGEQRRLPARRQRRDDAADVADEAEIEHAVRFVEHEMADLVQPQFAGGHQVADAARRADHDVGAAAHPLHLREAAHAAEDRDDPAALLAAEAEQAVLDLQGEFAGGGQDQGARGEAVRRGRVGGEMLQHRQRERRGLAGAGLGDAEQIAAGEQVRDGGCLDRRWLQEALLFQGRAARARQGRASKR